MKNKDCVFCNFSDKGVLIYENKVCFAVISKSPINKYHVMVIPRNHYESFVDLPNPTIKNIFITAKKLSSALRKACKPLAVTHISDDDIKKTGYNLVSHYKLHIIPRFKNDKVEINWNRDPDPGSATRAKYAKAIKKHL